MNRSFKDLIAFQRAMDLLVIVYEVTARFPKQEMYGLVSQLQRAATGVVSQIAEGSGRLTYGEWRQFLSQARGSLFEVEAQCMAAKRLGFLDVGSYEHVQQQITRTARTLMGLIRWVRSKERKHRLPTTDNRQPITASTPASSQNPQAPAPRSCADPP